MKGFPNQIADMTKIASALKILSDLLDKGKNPRDDGVYGEALVRGRIAGTGHTKLPIEEYLAKMNQKSHSYQAHRTTARGLRELFRVMGLITPNDPLALTEQGRSVVNIAGHTFGETVKSVWRPILLQMNHLGGDSTTSHPYQVLLRLVSQKPGISRAKCALALEAKDDSKEELDRILLLVNKNEPDIITEISTTKTNWDNGKKVLPHFAEQLGDVVKIENKFFLANSPGSHTTNIAQHGKQTGQLTVEFQPEKSNSRKTRSASKVTATTIAKAGTIENFDEKNLDEKDDIDPKAQKRKLEKLKSRLKRHNLIVQRLAIILEKENANLFENPFDCLGCFDDYALLIEVKSLDGTEADEISRVRDALAQPLYYEAFVTSPYTNKILVQKIACFETKIQDKHIIWLAKNGIVTIWLDERNIISASEASQKILQGHFGF